MKKIWTIITFLFSFIPTVWPIVKAIWGWVKPSPKPANVVDLPQPKELVIKEESLGASAEIIQAPEKLPYIQTSHADQAEAPILEEKKSPEITSFSIFSKGKAFLSMKEPEPEVETMSFMGSSQSGINIDPAGDIKNRSTMRDNSRMSSKLLF